MASCGEGASKMAPMWPGYGEIMTPCQRRRQSLLSYFWKRKFRLNMRNEISLNEEKNYQQPRKIWIWNSPIQKWKSPPWTIVFNLCRFATFLWQIEFTWELRPPGHLAGESASAWQRRWELSKVPKSQSRIVRILQAKLESNSEPERARVSQSVAMRASGSQSGSHREPERDRERHSKRQREPLRAWEGQLEPEWESQRAIESQRETGRDPVRAIESQ